MTKQNFRDPKHTAVPRIFHHLRGLCASVVKGNERLWCVLLLLLCITSSTTACVMVASQSFRLITMDEWIAQDLFTPVILWPPPGETTLRMGPYQGTHWVEMHYTEDFRPNDIPPAFELYQGAQPIAVGDDILWHFDAERNVDITHMRLDLLGTERAVEVRTRSDMPQTGTATFEIAGTHVVYHWRSVPQAEALDVLAKHIQLVPDDDRELIEAFDQALEERSTPTQDAAGQ